MAIKSKAQLNRGKRYIDLTGPQGNAFFLLGTAKKWSDALDKNWSAIEKEMTSGDYENLIKVFDREFGSICDLYR